MRSIWGYRWAARIDMMTHLGGGTPLPARIQSPEELELDRKRAALAALESELVERELELSTLEGELGVFEAEYLRVVGRRYAELDELRAGIAEARAACQPHDDATQQAASEARKTADASAAHAGHRAREEPGPPFDPPLALKGLYRSLARKLHPDLASTDEERTRRHQWMAKVNDAYQREDTDTLKSLFADWNASPESVSGQGIPSELIRVIRQIAQMRQRLDSISRAIQVLQGGELYALYQKCKARSSAGGGNLLEEIAGRLDDQIAAARHELAALEPEAP